jgi:hypothetical protein
VAVASRGDRPFSGGGGPAREPATAFWDYLFSLTVAGGVVGIAVMFWAVVTGKGSADLATRRRQTKLAGYVFLAAVVIGMVLGSRFARDGIFGRGSDQPVGSASPTTTGAADSAPEAYSPDFRWLPVLLLAGAGLATATILVARRRRRREGTKSEAELADELAALLDDTLDDLRAEPDPRRAVIAAYARTERALGAYGFPRRAFEAPLEYLDRIAPPLHERLPAARRLVFELTHLFERAKFSSHEIDATMKGDAISSLASLRDELRREEAA